MTLAEVFAALDLGVKLLAAIGRAIKSAAQGKDIEPEVTAEIRRCSEAIAALPGIHAAQQDELRRAVEVTDVG